MERVHTIAAGLRIRDNAECMTTIRSAAAHTEQTASRSPHAVPPRPRRLPMLSVRLAIGVRRASLSGSQTASGDIVDSTVQIELVTRGNVVSTL